MEGVGRHDLVDCYGRILQAGDFLIIKDLSVVTWRVVEIKPDLRADPEHPNVPTVQVTLAAVMQPRAAGGMPIANFVKIRDVGEDPAAQPAPPSDGSQP